MANEQKAHSWKDSKKVLKKEEKKLGKIADKNTKGAKSKAMLKRGTSNGHMVIRQPLPMPPAMPPATIPMGAPPMGAGAPAPAPQPKGGAPVRMPTPKRPPASSAQLPDDNMNAIA